MKTPFFDSLIDDFGIWQHTSGKRVFPSHGYALDDAARGFLLCLALDRQQQPHVLFDYLERSRHKQGFYGFATDKRQFFRFPSSEDAAGQVVWAMGYAVSKDFEVKRAQRLINDIKASLIGFEHMRGYAYAILGALYVDKRLAKQLMDAFWAFFAGTTDDWPWPEASMTYGNGLMPYVFLRYGVTMDDKKMADFGYRLLTFIQHVCEDNRIMGPIGNDGWYPKGSLRVPAYSQQPIDAAYMIWAWIAAYKYSGKNSDMENARRWMEWFEGNNIAHQQMYDPKTLLAYDGIDKKRVHHDSGAETNICFLMSRLMLEKNIII